MKKFVVGALVLSAFSIVAFPVFAASADFLAKATEYYQRRCTRSPERISREDSMLCYLFDRVQELDIELNNQSDLLSIIQDDIATNSAAIDTLKDQPHGKHVLDYAQYQSTEIWTTTAETDVATPSQIKLNCPVKCVLNINYWADNRTDNIQADPVPAQAHQIIYVDGVRTNNYSSAVFRVIGDPLMVSIGGLFPVDAGEHTIQIYAWQHYGTLDIREKVLTGVAFEQ